MYSVIDPVLLTEAGILYHEIKQVNLIGNKVDLKDERPVSEEQIRKFEHNMC
jgi:hypothetical protein